MKCPCGRDINSTVNTRYSFIRFDSQGNIVYAVCVHGKPIKCQEIKTPEPSHISKKTETITMSFAKGLTKNERAV